MLPAVTSEINEYDGINPHLNDQLQQPHGQWDEFHQLHLTYLHATLNQALRGTGYKATFAPSLQIRDLDENTGLWNPPRYPEPDVSIRDVNAPRTGRAPDGPFVPDLNSPIREMDAEQALNLDPEKYARAIAIRRVDTIDDPHGKPVAWIELLSPSNKPGGSHYGQYQDKRVDIIREGQTLVELDYLHLTRPVINEMPRYKPDRTGEVPPDASPYYISVIDPRPAPDYPGGSGTIYPFGVDARLPEVFIPLAEDNQGFTFDFDPAYDMAIQNHYAGEIDYTQPPVSVDTYSKQDQDKIAARQLTILQGAARGLLDDPNRKEPLPLAFALEGATQKLDNVLRGIEPLEPPPPSPDLSPDL